MARNMVQYLHFRILKISHCFNGKIIDPKGGFSTAMELMTPKSGYLHGRTRTSLSSRQNLLVEAAEKLQKNALNLKRPKKKANVCFKVLEALVSELPHSKRPWVGRCTKYLIWQRTKHLQSQSQTRKLVFTFKNTPSPNSWCSIGCWRQLSDFNNRVMDGDGTIFGCEYITEPFSDVNSIESSTVNAT
jgi:hypothetical protein